MPEWLIECRYRIRALIHRRRLERDLQDELRFHVDMREARLQAEGLPTADAHWEASRRFGNETAWKEICREMWTFSFLEVLKQDLRYALRMMRTQPAFTAIAVLALGLGIGANTAIFSVVNTLLLQPLPYTASDQLVGIFETFPPSGWGSVSMANFVDWREQNTVFSGLAAYSRTSSNLQDAASPERIPTVAATANLFSLLGRSPLIGRAFLPDEDQPEKPLVAIMSETLWERRFGRDPQLLNRQIRLDGESYTVIGIMPADFQYPPGSALRTELWVPLKPLPNYLNLRGNHAYAVLGRLKPGISVEQAQTQLAQVARRLAEQYPGQQKGRSVLIRPLQDLVVRRVRQALYMLLGAVGFVVLIACANVANLLLARSAARRRELAVRAAMGAGRWRLVRQLITESVLMALMGGVVALAIAFASVRALKVLAAGTVPMATSVHLDASVFGYLLLLCVFAGFAFGIIPALQTTRGDLQKDLRDAGSKGSLGGRVPQWTRHSLIVGEFALALVLSIGAGLLIRAFVLLQNTDSGLNIRNVLTMRVALPIKSYGSTPPVARFYQPVLNRVRELPGVQSAGFISHLPLRDFGMNGNFSIEGRPDGDPASAPFAEFRLSSPGYFRALGIPILQGRDMSEQDGANTQSVVWVNRSLADQYFPKESPLGRRVQAIGNGWSTIAGVVGDIKGSTLDAKPVPEIYVPVAQIPNPNWAAEMTLVVNSTMPTDSVNSAVRQAIRDVDPAQPVYAVTTMEEVVASSLADRRLYSWLLGSFAAIALTLAAAGIYGVMSYLVAQRTQEFGVRMALGASLADVLNLVLKQGIVLVTAGLVIGWLGAAATTRILSSWLYGVTPTDAATFAAVSLLLSAVALLAVYIPARRATRVDPLIALRYE